MSDDFSYLHEPLSSPDLSALDDRVNLALLLGAAAAVAAGLMWAALVFLTKMEIGWVAWGVGLLVGFAMSRATTRRSKQLAYAAAAFAVMGLVCGKAFIFMGSSGQIAAEIEQDDQLLSGALAWQMYAREELDPETAAAVAATEARGDTLSDALWGEMQAQAAAKLATMSADQKHDVALVASQGAIQSMGMLGGIRAQLSFFDLLWVLLAVGTAFQMLAPPKQAPAPSAASA